MYNVNIMAKIDNIDRPTDSMFLLFHYADEVVGITKVQKLMFLIENETEFGNKYSDRISYHFEAYKMGPFSPEVYTQIELLLSMKAIETEDMRKTASEGREMKEWYKSNEWIEEPGSEGLSYKVFRTTEKGHKIGEALARVIDEQMRSELKEVIQQYNSMPLRQLLQYVYTEYEDMTDKSEIKNEVLEY